MDAHGKELKLNFITGTLVVDSINVFIRVQGDVPFLNFIQMRGEDERYIYGDVVASVRLNGLQELKDLAEMITQTVEQHQNREE